VGFSASAELYAPAAGTFSPTGDMTTARFEHTETPLGNGKVLIAGSVGGSGDALASAELYDEATGTFTATGNMTEPRSWHTATQVVSGKVLIAVESAVAESTARISRSAEVYDPKAGRFTATDSNDHGTVLPHGDVVDRRERTHRGRRILGHSGSVQSERRDVHGDRQHEWTKAVAHGNAIDERKGAPRRRRRIGQAQSCTSRGEEHRC